VGTVADSQGFGIEVEVFRGSGNGGAIQPHGQNTVAGICPVGSYAVGGEWNSPANVIEERPIDPSTGDQGWMVTATNDTDQVLNVSARTLCLRVR
jgi:hypothetical protein